MRRTTLLLGSLLLALVVTVAGCARENDERDADRAERETSRLAPPDQDSPPPTGVSLSFIQQRVDELGDFAQLRVINESGQPLAVGGVGLDWPGYDPFVTDYETVVEPGRVLDLRFELPAPDCAAHAAALAQPVVGRLRLSDGVEVDDELDESGTGYVTRIRQRRCDDERVAGAVDLRYGPGWRIEGTGRRARLTGTITLLRRDGDDGRVAVTEIAGSVLLRPVLSRPLVLAPGQQSASVKIAIVIPRCDEHALTESSQTFGFKPTFRFGAGSDAGPGAGSDAASVTVLRVPDAGTRQAAQRLLRRACVVDGSAE